jgi:Secretion system C-terminal sorting domain
MQNVKSGYLLLLLLWLPAVAFSQIRQYAPGRKVSAKAAVSANAKRHAVNPVSLPFWDDFSFAKGYRADSLLWIVNDKVFVNDGQAINPPSINVATFDGYNENGLPYSTVSLETGYGDTLESQPIRMGDVATQYRDKIYLSFFYQAGGNGEMPNPSDFLKLEFKSSGGWVEIHKFTIESNADRSVFYDTAIQIPQALLPGEPDYFHNQFQFRFTSFGRLSGSYDAWHLDYVYLNRRVNDDEEALDPATGNSVSSTPLINENDKNTNTSDRTVTKPFSSILGEYFSIPIKHFNVAKPFEKLTVSMYSLKHVGFLQPVSYTAIYKITNYYDGTPTVTYHESPDGGKTSFEPGIFEIPVLKHADGQTRAVPASTTIDPDADSVEVQIILGIDAGDNGGTLSKDYYDRYIPINFRSNDTLQYTFRLSNYYAYDDGTAEYSAGLAAQGNQLAYRFVMDQNVVTDNILNGMFIYFPFTGGSAPETVRIFVFKDKAGKPDSSSVYSQTIPVTRSANNLFSEVDFSEGVIVQDTFYIGYQETVTGKPDRIRVGLDASHNTGEQMYYRNTVYHPWIQNTELKGCLMIRPRFGEATVITGEENSVERLAIFPNPNHGQFYVKGRTDDIQIFSLTGQSVGFSSENTDGGKKVALQNPNPGVYVIRYRNGSNIRIGKILVTAN